MRTAVCGHNPVDHLVRVVGEHTWLGRYPGYKRAIIRRSPLDILICDQCWDAHSNNGRGFQLANPDRPKHPIFVWHPYRSGPLTDALPCAGCGVRVRRGKPGNYKIHTCSRACTKRASKAAHASPVSRTVTLCPCGNPATGRADSQYCSNACRQRAYRQRRARSGGSSISEQELRQAFALTDGVTDEMFEQAIARARAEQDLSHDNLVRKIEQLNRA